MIVMGERGEEEKSDIVVVERDEKDHDRMDKNR